jgi:periplasmic divalent cation tolerance protein
MEATGSLVVLVAARDRDDAMALGRVLVDERLAACVTVVPAVTSLYVWEGKREETSEALLLIKTEASRYPSLERRVLALHSYTTPEVLALPVCAGAPAYVRWLRESVGA